MVRIRPKLSSEMGGYLLFGIPLTAIAVYNLLTLLIEPHGSFDWNTTSFYVEMLVLAILALTGSIWGTYIVLRPTEMLRSELFWRTRYRYDQINRIYQMKHWFLGSILIIDHGDRFGVRNASRLLAVSLFGEDDLRALLATLHSEHPHILLDEFCLGVVNSKRQSRAA